MSHYGTMVDMEGHDPLWTREEVAVFFRVDPKTIRRWTEAGKLPMILTPGGHARYKDSDVRALAASQAPGPANSPQVPPAGPGPDSKEGRAPRGGARPNPAT